jgi:hypothetical protein
MALGAQMVLGGPGVAAGVSSVSGTGNTSSTGGANPVVSITAAPVFSNVTDSALTSGQCVQASTAGLLSTIGAACATAPIIGYYQPYFNQTSASFTIPAVGSSVTVAGAYGTPVVDQFVPMTITDGSVNTITGVWNATGPTFTVKSIVNGSAGNTMAASSYMISGSSTFGTGNGTVTGVTGTGNISVTAGATPVVSETNAPTFTGTVTAGSLYATPNTGGGIGTAGRRFSVELWVLCFGCDDNEPPSGLPHVQQCQHG